MRKDHSRTPNRTADQLRFVSFSAVLAGIKEIKESHGRGRTKIALWHRTIVFVDESSPFQQSPARRVPPHVETGHIIFIGATTENPFLRSHLAASLPHQVTFSIHSRRRTRLLRRGLNSKEHRYGNESVEAPDDILFRIASFARRRPRPTTPSELAVRSAPSNDAGTRIITPELLEDVLQRKTFATTSRRRALQLSPPCTNPFETPI